MTFVVKTGGDPLTVVPALRTAVRELDVNQPIARVQTLASMLDRALWLSRASAMDRVADRCLGHVVCAARVFASASFAVSLRKAGKSQSGSRSVRRRPSSAAASYRTCWRPRRWVRRWEASWRGRFARDNCLAGSLDRSR
jgi:hypothetical protein